MSEIEQCVLACNDCAGLFRLGRSVEAALNMLEVFETADGLLERNSPAVRQQWSQLLVEMLACQQSQDWLGLADYMQYELTELVHS
ncbi:MAG: hypothetical protein ABWY17_00795 [Pseudomonas sp.]|jgi:hypothetical protein|uniref:hypothetical protein n=1 Tax=Pseudomonas sp. CFII64 TaxID=911242 RepID=UPI0003573D55|nr:hypothetical protein [Pseudomonas sp. CFII64]EPJ86258.1 hypothetical protein CFII64_10624 [Pseudomonas sp. CFII64]